MANPFVKAFDSIKEWSFKKYSDDPSKMLLHTGTVAWILSAGAQLYGIHKNDKLTKDQKKFLLPQEFLDAVINITAFYILTNNLQNLTKKLATTGKVIPSKIQKYCENNAIEIGDWKKSDIGKALTEKISTAKANIDTNELKGLKEEFDTFESGMKMVGNITGAVVSSNIITPLLRNPLAAMKQKYDISHDKQQTPIQKPNTQPIAKQPLNSYQPKLAQPTGGMKV